MLTVVDLKAEPAKLKMLAGRTPTTPESEREGAFARLATYRDGGVFMAKFAGTSAWERHPKGDEIVQVVEGATTLHLITDAGRQSLALSAGMVVIVPQNAWHQFVAPDGVCVMTTTPQPTQHLNVDVDDPRTVE
ncbi:MAG TPA: cupin domain-containing protein [Candidatus Sulfotelmatobacter sp.]|nr:cupin domain-containing protein [Candidatus Sulfotelmatobacter sp.]